MEETSESLIAAIEHNRTDIVRSVISTCENNLIDDGEGTLKSIINEPFTEHGTVLHFATKLGQKDIIRTLLAAGADPGTQNQTGQTAVEMATDDQILQPFNEHLLQAIAHSNLGSVCQLLAAGLDVNLFDSPTSQNTPLHWATSYSDHHMVHALIKRGARVNAANSEGVTPLHEAVNRGDKAIIAELLKENADVEVKPSEGKFESQTPFEMASSRPSLIRLFNNSDSLNGDLHETDENESSLSEGSIQHHKTNGFIPSKSTNNQHCNGTVTMDTVTMDTITMDTVTVNCDEVYASNKIQTSSASKQHAPQRLVTDSRLHYLWPQPQHIFPISPTQTDSDSTENSTPRVEDPTSFCVSGDIMLYVVQNVFFSKDLYDLCETTSKTWTELHSIDVTIKRYNPHIVKQPESKISLLEQTLPAPEIVEPAEIFAEINKQLCTKENGYKITVQAKQIRILAHDICGMFYALQTIQQLFQLCAEQGVPLIHISDWPTIRDRGILLDLSKGRIHTMNSLRVSITTLASLKVNQLYLYMRFTPVTDVDDFWQFPYSSCDLLMLSSFCEAHHMTLSPVFDVTSEVTFDDLSMLQMAFNKSLVCFPNTGVVSIGPRLSSLLIDTSSYLHNLSLFINHTIQLCAYVFHDSTNALNSLPPNTSLIEYGFTADYDFYSQCTKYIESGNCFSVMCGTAAWNSLAGCPEAAMANIFNAVDAVSTVGGIGLILAQWSGLGHLTSHCISWPAFIAMAGLTWNNHIHSDYMYANIADLIDYHMVNQPHCRLGEVIINLGRTETYLIRSARQQSGKDQKDLPSDLGSLLYQLLSRPDETSIEQLTPEVIHKITRHIHQSQSILKPLTNTENLTAIDSAVQLSACDIVVQELELAMALMLTACRIGRGLLSLGTHQNYTSVINVGVTNLLPTQKTDIANRLLSHMAAIKDVWTLRHSDTNIATSTALLQTLLHKLIPDTNTKC